jgi:hypothetical protein
MSSRDQRDVLALLAESGPTISSSITTPRLRTLGYCLKPPDFGHLRPSSSWRPRSWADRLAALPMPEEELVRRLAKAIYNTHAERELVGPHGRAPYWENASGGVREWVKEQARAALACLQSLERGSL